MNYGFKMLLDVYLYHIHPVKKERERENNDASFIRNVFFLKFEAVLF